MKWLTAHATRTRITVNAEHKLKSIELARSTDWATNEGLPGCDCTINGEDDQFVDQGIRSISDSVEYHERREKLAGTCLFIPERCAWNIQHSVAEMRTSQQREEIFWTDVMIYQIKRWWNWQYWDVSYWRFTLRNDACFEMANRWK